MPAPIVETELATCAATIRTEYAVAEQSERAAITAYRAVGRALLTAKGLCGHGKWLAWLKANVSFSQQRARQLMALAKSLVTSDLESEWRIIQGNSPAPTEDDPPADAPEPEPAPTTGDLFDPNPPDEPAPPKPKPSRATPTEQSEPPREPLPDARTALNDAIKQARALDDLCRLLWKTHAGRLLEARFGEKCPIQHRPVRRTDHHGTRERTELVCVVSPLELIAMLEELK